ncbi:uroporphyrinogen-III synthase [Tepidamorphus sp. 3E244]|uniref:uroporphyrinogen-III synthase n=1 Tax=Tepidamorphus sp. 3E244 TaxID=3385498 RepID=UPI0038FD1B02
MAERALRVLVTRPADAAARTVSRLEALGHEPILAPALDIVLQPFSLPARSLQAIAITSASVVPALVAHRATLDGVTIYAVGDQTADKARATGFVDVRAPAAPGGVEVLADHIAGDVNPAGGLIVHIGARDTAGDLTGALFARGFQAERVVAYAAEPVPTLPDEARADIANDRLDAALFHSPRSAAAFFDLIKAEGLSLGERVRFLCLSPAVAAMMPETQERERILVAKTPDEDAMMELLRALDIGEVGDR